MKTIIAGVRWLDENRDRDVIFAAMNSCPWRDQITEVVSGACMRRANQPSNFLAKGADGLGEYWAHVSQIPVKRFFADWHKFSTSAGPLRNREMAIYGDALVALWDGESKGTQSMIDEFIRFNYSVPLFLGSFAEVPNLHIYYVG